MPLPANIAALLLQKNLDKNPTKTAYICGEDA